MELDLLAIGDPTLDTYLRIHDNHVALELDAPHSHLRIDYADKIPVDSCVQCPGGNAVNVAISCAGLGLRAGIVGTVGGDAAGASILSALRKRGVDVGHVTIDHEAGTNASVAIVFRGERTLFVWHEPRSYRLPRRLPGCLYLTSVGPPGPGVEALHAAVCRAVDRTGARLAFSPGTHQLRMGRRALAGLLKRTWILLLNREEAAELTGRQPDDVPALLGELRALGPRTAVVTDGPAGSWALGGESVLHAGIAPARVVDRTGAGDAYSSALVTAVLLGLPLREAMLWGTVQAAHKVSVEGATAGLLERPQLERAVALHRELVPPAA